MVDAPADFDRALGDAVDLAGPAGTLLAFEAVFVTVASADLERALGAAEDLARPRSLAFAFGAAADAAFPVDLARALGGGAAGAKHPLVTL